MLSSSDAANVRILSHNVRYATKNRFPGEESWAVRCPRLCAQLVFNSLPSASTFICLQEVLHEQLLDIHKALKESAADWEYIGVGRDDGEKAGEYSPVFYRTSAWHLRSWTTTWLSETPTKPSMGWDATCMRILTTGNFSHRTHKRLLTVMSTHLDDRGVVSRAKSAQLILASLSEFRQEGVPVLLGGDFNSSPDGEAYKLMAGPRSGMEDVGAEVKSTRRHGNEDTFTGFMGEQRDRQKIDFIFASTADDKSKDHHDILSFGVLENRFDDGVYLSDHRAVAADLLLTWHD